MTDYRDYGPILLTCLSEMPRFPSVAQHFFELYEYNSGITSDELSPTSIGISFFAWISMDHLAFQPGFPRRRIILSLLDKDHRGFELFLSETNLLVAVHYSKTGYTAVETTKTIVDSSWHSIAVVWAFGSILGSQGSCEIFVDGMKISVAKMSFSSVDRMKIRLGCGLDMPSQHASEMKNSTSLTSMASFGKLFKKLF
jgi:hypothetical protein